MKLRRVRADHLPNDLARHTQLPADLLDRLPKRKISPAYLGDRLHNQHSNLGLPESWRPVWTLSHGGPDWMKISPVAGSLFHEKEHARLAHDGQHRAADIGEGESAIARHDSEERIGERNGNARPLPSPPRRRHEARPGLSLRAPSAAHLTGKFPRAWAPPRGFFDLAPFFEKEPVGAIRTEHSSGGGVSAAGGARMEHADAPSVPEPVTAAYRW